MAYDPKSDKDERKSQKHEKKLAAKKAEQKKNRTNTIVFACILLVIALFAALVIFNKCSTDGSRERRTVAASTENYEVSEAMVTYFFNSMYNQYLNIYGQSQDGLKTFVDGVNNHDSMYDTIMSTVKNQVEQYLTHCEMARDKGIELDADEKETIDKTIEAMEEAQIKNGYNGYSLDFYISRLYGNCVDESVVRKCLELEMLAEKYVEEVTEERTYTDEEY